jgi:4-amino-4-deoxy-L-arabinose transferase-like glycosyltransferase
MYLWIAILLCIPAFILNLDKLPFIGDEAIRSLVALEMMLSNNYIVPTMRGDFYFSKPPLYNWILILFFKLSGTLNEFVARIPTVIFTYAFTFLIWFFNKNRFQHKKHAIILAFSFLTCGRMIFYDSFLGLIDIFFSMVTYTMIIWAYYMAERNRMHKMYVMLYALSVIGLMLKGLPTLHFLTFTLLIIHYIFGKWEMLRSKTHLLSFLGALLIILSYFYLYNNYIDAHKTMAPLIDQATRRTIIRYDIIDMLKHLISYPIENLYHFFPWTLLGFLVFQSGILKIIKSNRYIWYSTLCFISNFIVYWISPEVFPRYILMLIPLIFTVWIFLYEFEIGVSNKRMEIISILYKIIAVIIPVALLTQWNNSQLYYVGHHQLKMITLIMSLIFTAILYFKDKANRPIIFIIYILILRIGFNAFVLPIRAITGDDEVIKRESLRISNKYHDLKLYKNTKLNQINTFYISNHHQKILNRSSNLRDAKYFIIDSTYQHDFYPIDSLPDGDFCGTRWIINGIE